MILSWLLSNLRVGTVNHELRPLFRDTVVPAIKAPKNHTHSASAVSRSKISAFADVLGAATGFRPYFYQMSASDQREGRRGWRDYYWAKDLKANYSHTKLSKTDMVVMVDVDYYVDMPDFCAMNANPYLLYSFTPTTVAEDSSEETFTFQGNSAVEMRVSGGAVYNHRLWDYGYDTLAAHTFRWWFWPISTYYQVERRGCGKHRSMILLEPFAQYSGLMAVLSWTMGSQPLKRLVVADGENTALRVITPEGSFVSRGVVGEYACLTVKSSVDSALLELARYSKTDINVATIASYSGLARDLCRVPAASVLRYYANAKRWVNAVVYLGPEKQQNYHFGLASYDAAAKKSMIPFMSPVVQGACFAPLLDEQNYATAVTKRVIEPQNKHELKVTKKLYSYMLEFVHLLINEDEAFKGEPVEWDLVVAKQNRPSQRRLLALGIQLFRDCYRKLTCMLKREAYVEPKDPRMITIDEPEHKARFAAYAYAVGKFLKTKHWYAFGCTPREIAGRVVEVCVSSQNVAQTDFTRLDGHIGVALRIFDAMVYSRFFSDAHRNEALRVQRESYDRLIITPYEQVYSQNLAQGSGEMDTSDSNSLRNKFVQYIANRLAGESPQVAYEHPGLFGGDDGISGNVQPEVYSRAAKMVGLEVKVELITPASQYGPKFLARQYGPLVWWGDDNSMTDIRRCLSKLHVTTNVLARPQQKAEEKFWALALSDYNTPIIADLLSWWAKQGFTLKNWNLGVGSYWAQIYQEENQQYPNRPGTWMVELVCAEFPRYEVWRRHLKQVKFPIVPLLESVEIPETRRDLVVNGEVVGSGTEKCPTPKEIQESSEKTVRNVRGLEKAMSKTAGYAPSGFGGRPIGRALGSLSPKRAQPPKDKPAKAKVGKPAENNVVRFSDYRQDFPRAPNIHRPPLRDHH